MAELTIDELMRTAHVTRWQIVRTLRQQTLAEHSYLVTMITMKICEVIGFPKEQTSLAVKWALYHDTPEVITGDIATPVKERMQIDVCSGISDTYDLLSEYVKGNVFYYIVKIADTIEAIRFLRTEGVGSHAMKVADELLNKYDVLLNTAKNNFTGLKWDLITPEIL